MKNIDLSLFMLVEPLPSRNEILSAHIMADGTLRTNVHLRKKISTTTFCLYLSSDAREMLLAEAGPKQPAARNLNKSGALRAPELPPLLSKLGIQAPARYLVSWNDSVKMWLCEYDSTYTFPAQRSALRKKVGRPRKTDLYDMLPKAG